MGRIGGGIALVTQRKYKITTIPETTVYDSFEHDIWNIQIGPGYRNWIISPSTRNKCKSKQCKLSRPAN